MNVLQSLTELYNSQSTDSVYRDLAQRILSNLADMRKVTIYDVAELTASSRTTVWRLVQKLGYDSFSDFRYALQSAASQYVYYNRMMEQRKTSSTERLLDEVGSQLKDTAALFKNDVTAALVDELTDEIHTSSGLYFFLPFRTAFAYSFQLNLWKDEKKAEYRCLVPNMLEAAENLDKTSIVLISTIEYAETLDMTSVFEKIRQKGSTLWLAGNAASHFTHYADRHLLTGEVKPAAWLLGFEAFLLSLSERYRGKFID